MRYLWIEPGQTYDIVLDTRVPDDLQPSPDLDQDHLEAVNLNFVSLDHHSFIHCTTALLKVFPWTTIRNSSNISNKPCPSLEELMPKNAITINPPDLFQQMSKLSYPDWRNDVFAIGNIYKEDLRADSMEHFEDTIIKVINTC